VRTFFGVIGQNFWSYAKSRGEAMSHSSRVELFEIMGSRGLDVRRRQTIKNQDVDPRDGDECRDLLRRLSKQYGIDPKAAELLVWEGRTKERFRL
jgi:hypothetical protein